MDYGVPWYIRFERNGGNLIVTMDVIESLRSGVDLDETDQNHISLLVDVLCYFTFCKRNNTRNLTR